jgi:hypothetical protein
MLGVRVLAVSLAELEKESEGTKSDDDMNKFVLLFKLREWICQSICIFFDIMKSCI